MTVILTSGGGAIGIALAFPEVLPIMPNAFPNFAPSWGTSASAFFCRLCQGMWFPRCYNLVVLAGCASKYSA